MLLVPCGVGGSGIAEFTVSEAYSRGFKHHGGQGNREKLKSGFWLYLLKFPSLVAYFGQNTNFGEYVNSNCNTVHYKRIFHIFK